MRQLCGVVLLGAAATFGGCGDDGGRESAGDSSISPTTSLTGGTSTGASVGTDDGESASAATEGGDATTDGTTTDNTTTTSAGTTGEGTESDSSGDATTTAATTTGETGSSTTMDVRGTTGTDTGIEECPPDDPCCMGMDQLPPHKLLDAFLGEYPAELMPKSAMEVKDFAPAADGHMMAWSALNVGNELVDVANGGVIEANIEEGRGLARAAAEDAIPADALALDVREDPIVIEDLGGPPPCVGVGWGWGSILFENADSSIGEVVYLYVGYCASGDVEAFYFSNQSVEVCAPQ